MKIFIITMDDPLFTIPFLKKILIARKKDICGIALVKKGNRLSVGKNNSKSIYLLSLLIILGPFHFFINTIKTITYKAKKKISKYLSFISSPCIVAMASNMNIPTFIVDNANDKDFLNSLKKIAPDVIINQCQNILKKDILSIPVIGTINRHNALLPKNRGRLTPFWVIYKKESETGVSIHFVQEGIDTGDIIVQERIKVSPRESISSLVKKNYEIAPIAMLKALNLLESGIYKTIKNDNDSATYNSIPTFKDAVKFRYERIMVHFK